jgi:hypothetical protein
MAIGKKITPFKKASPLKNPMLIGGIIGGVGAVGGLISSYAGAGARNDEAANARTDLNKRLGQFEQLPTDNLYAGAQNQFADMENTYEDITVNQQQAQFQAQQQQQQQASIMQGLSGAAGSSGVAGLAQAMANQGTLATQKASASIGLQESQNQLAAAKGAAQTQYYERAGAAQTQQMQLQGAADARNLEYQKVQGLLAAATGRMTAANTAIENAKNRQMQMWSSIMNLGTTALTGPTGKE